MYGSGPKGRRPIRWPFTRTLYRGAGLVKETDRLKQLGEHKVGGGCSYIKQLRHVDLNALEHLIPQIAKAMAEQRLK